MKTLLAPLILVALATPAPAETVLAARTIRARTLITAADVTLSEGEVAGAYTSLEEVIGSEARVAIYAGRPVRSGEIGQAAVVDRNQVVTLVYASGGLVISTEGRSLGRAGTGEIVRVMNLGSRQTVSGRVQDDGTVVVGTAPQTLLSN
ncbi:MAG: flagella basal body P-ring formation protein FlgA [Rhodobacterales bacterium]|nr:MAG: flagella basal body P-ring formation protein FlgA [Rhodobacterales bacterium]